MVIIKRIIIGLVVVIAGAFSLLWLGFSCTGAKLQRQVSLTDDAGVHCACNHDPQSSCFP
jgi:hypothetical protein